jgi:selenide,water dikinase
VTRLLLLGGGHAHALVLRRLREFISKNLQVVLLSPGPAHTYSGMVPGVIAGHYAAADAQIDLARLASEAGAELVRGRLLRLDPADKQAHLVDGDVLGYDVASLNLGSLPDFLSVPGAGEHAVAVKPFERFFERWRDLLAHGPAAPRIAVVGAGAGGVEVAMAMKFALEQRGTGGAVTLYSDRNVFPAAVAARIRRAIEGLSIQLRAGTPVTALEPGPSVISSAGRERFDAVFWTAGAAPLPLLRESGLATDARGYALVDVSLRSVSHPDVFAAGDTASVEGLSIPRSGVYAVRQAAVLAENLMRIVRGAPMLDYAHRSANLALISCGGKYAIASRGGWSAEGRWAWRWKDWLDRRWIARFR